MSNKCANICYSLIKRFNNDYELLYELAVTCAQIAQVDNFELFVKTDYKLNSKNNKSYNTDSSGTETKKNEPNIKKQQLKQSKQQWYAVVRSANNSTNSVKLKRIQKQKKSLFQVLKLIACNKVIIGCFF